MKVSENKGGFDFKLKAGRLQSQKANSLLILGGAGFLVSLFILILFSAWPLLLSVLLGFTVGSFYEILKQKFISSSSKLVISKRLRKNKYKLAVSLLTLVAVLGCVVGVGFFLGPALGLFVLPSTSTIISTLVSKVTLSVAGALFAALVAGRTWVYNIFENRKKRSVTSWTLSINEVEEFRVFFRKNGASPKRVKQQMNALQDLIDYVTLRAKRFRFLGVFRIPGFYHSHDYYKQAVIAVKERNFSYMKAFILHEMKYKATLSSKERQLLACLKYAFSNQHGIFSSFEGVRESGFRPVEELEKWHYKKKDTTVKAKINQTLMAFLGLSAIVGASYFFPVVVLAAAVSTVVIKSSQELYRNVANILFASKSKKKKSVIRLTSGSVCGIVAGVALAMNPVGVSLLAIFSSAAVVLGSFYIGSKVAKQILRKKRLSRSVHTNPEKYTLPLEKKLGMVKEAASLQESQGMTVSKTQHHRLECVVGAGTKAIERQLMLQLMSVRRWGSSINPKSVFQYLMMSSRDRAKVKGWKFLFEGYKSHGLLFAQDAAVYISHLLQREIDDYVKVHLARLSEKKHFAQVEKLQKIQSYFSTLDSRAAIDLANLVVYFDLDAKDKYARKCLTMFCERHDFIGKTKGFISLGRPAESTHLGPAKKRLHRHRRWRQVKRASIGTAAAVTAVVAPHAILPALTLASKAKAGSLAVPIVKGGVLGGGLSSVPRKSKKLARNHTPHFFNNPLYKLKKSKNHKPAFSYRGG